MTSQLYPFTKSSGVDQYLDDADGIRPERALNVDHGYSAKTVRHSVGTNYALYDGHVRWLRDSSVSSRGSAISPNDQQNVTGAAISPAGSVYNADGTNDPAFLGTLNPT